MHDEMQPTKTEKFFIGTLKCHDCGAVLNTSNPVPESQQARAILASAFAAGQCPNKCRSTFSDLNINTDLIWESCPAPEETEALK